MVRTPGMGAVHPRESKAGLKHSEIPCTTALELTELHWVHCQSSTGYWVHCQLGIRYWVLGTGYWVLGTKLKCTALELTGSGCCTVSEAADELHHLLWDNISFYIQPEELFSDKTKN